MNLTSLFNIKGLAIALGIGFAAGIGSGYFLAVGQYESAALSAANKAAAAQHKQDVAQHGVAVNTSHAAATQGAATQANTGQQVQVIHDTKTIFLNNPAICPADPELDPAVLDAFNKAGH
jgi:hypothetical protein